MRTSAYATKHDTEACKIKEICIVEYYTDLLVQNDNWVNDYSCSWGFDAPRIRG